MGLEYVPSYGNFVLVRVGDAAAVYERLLRAGVIVRPVANYGLPEWLRVTVGLPDENRAFLAALSARARSLTGRRVTSRAGHGPEDTSRLRARRRADRRRRWRRPQARRHGGADRRLLAGRRRAGGARARPVDVACDSVAEAVSGAAFVVVAAPVTAMSGAVRGNPRGTRPARDRHRLRQHQAQRDRSGARARSATRSCATCRAIRSPVPSEADRRRPIRTCFATGAGCCVRLDATPQQHCEAVTRLLDPTGATSRARRAAARPGVRRGFALAARGRVRAVGRHRRRRPGRAGTANSRAPVCATRRASVPRRRRCGPTSCWTIATPAWRRGAISRQQRRAIDRRARGERSRGAGGARFETASRWRRRLS